MELNKCMPTNFRNFVGLHNVNKSNEESFLRCYGNIIERSAVYNNLVASEWGTGKVSAIHNEFLSGGLGYRIIKALTDKIVGSSVRIEGKDNKFTEFISTKTLTKKIRTLIASSLRKKMLGELDTATISFYTDCKKVFDKWSKIDIEITDRDSSGSENKEKFSFVLFEYDYSIKSSGYLYTLVLIEPTKILENIIVDGIAVTNGEDLYDQFTQMVNKINMQQEYAFGYGIRIEISYSIKEKMYGMAPHDFIYSDQRTAREILDDIASCVDCEVRVIEYIPGINRVVISLDDPNKKNRMISLDEFTEINGSNNSEYEVGGIRAIGVNTVGGIMDEGYQSLRTPNGYISDTNSDCLVTTFGIREVSELLMSAIVDFSITKESYANNNVSSITTVETKEVVIELTQYVRNKKVYDILTDIGKRTILYYSDNEPCVYGFNELHEFKEQLINKNRSTLNNIITDLKDKDAFDWPHKGEKGYSLTNISLRNYKFKCKYAPVFNSLYDEDKKNYQNNPTRVLISQNEGIIDVEKFGMGLNTQIRRLGNREQFVDISHSKLAELYELGDYTKDRFIIDSRELAFSPQKIVARYHMTKDYAYRGQSDGLNRLKRISNIPLENYVDRMILIDGGDVSAAMIEDKIEDYRIIAVHSNEMNDGEYGVLFGVSYNTENSVYVLYKALDNYSLGRYKPKEGSQQVMNDIPYVDSKGTCNSIVIKPIKYGMNYDTSSLALIHSDELDQGFNAIDREIVLSDIFKDSYESLTFVIKFKIFS